MRVLVVVDFQKDFVDGALGFPEAAALEGPIEAKVGEYVANGDMVVFTKDMHDADRYPETQEGRRLPVPHCIDPEGSAIYGSVARYCSEGNTVVKDRFGSEDLAARLSFYQGQFDQIELCGLVGSMCVLSNAVVAKAALPEAELLVDAACTAGPDPGLHASAMALLETLQITVTNREDGIQ